MSKIDLPVRFVFGQNLKHLMNGRVSKRALASEIGVSRTQLERYLTGQSTPKVETLKRVCDFFDVDANILMHPLYSKSGVDDVVSGLYVAGRNFFDMFQSDPGARAPYLDPRLHIADDDMPSGIYRMWLTSHARPGMLASTLTLVDDFAGAKRFRVAALGWQPPGAPQRTKLPRDFMCGVIVRQDQYHVAVSFDQHTGSVGFWFSDVQLSAGPNQRIVSGFYHWRGESPLKSSSYGERYVCERVNGGFVECLAIAREDRYIPRRRAPEHVQYFLEHPDKTARHRETSPNTSNGKSDRTGWTAPTAIIARS